LETSDILVVDDDMDLRRTLVLLLNKKYSVVEAGNGIDALFILEKLRPRLILLDISMPVMSGLEVLGAARQKDGTLKVVMLTSHQELELAKNALDLGALAYITKPFDADFIRDEVDRLLAPVVGQEDSGRPWHVKDQSIIARFEVLEQQ
jgi:DNA-binding NtrC family response regulator